MGRTLGTLIVMICGLCASDPAEALEIAPVDPGICVDGVAGLPANGIPTGALVTDPVVRLCDGTWRRLAIRDNLLQLASSEQGPATLDPSAAEALRLPDGETTRGPGSVAEAWLIGPTETYTHGILGDATEASGFHLRLVGGGRRELFLGSESVFEDLRVRLVDLTGDGLEEILLIRSYLNRGAALAVYGLTSRGLPPLGESPAIGLPNRWLNPAGAADFDGDGEVEVALIETPHIGGTLKIFALREEGLVLEASAPGFSNHAIGSRILDLSAVLDWDNDGRADLAVPDAGRGGMTVVALTAGRIVRLATQKHEAQIATAVLATDMNGDGRPELLYGLRGGALVLLRP